MTYLSDTLTVGLVLILLFGSIALFLYTRVQQTEQKVSLLESILLDLNLKFASDVKGYDELPEDHCVVDSSSSSACSSSSSVTIPISSDSEHTSAAVAEEEAYTPFEESVPEISEENPASDSAPAYVPFEDKSASASQGVSNAESSEYESMTVKELQALAKMRNVSISSSAKKSAIIDALKAAEQNSSGLLSSLSSMENHSLVSDEL